MLEKKTVTDKIEIVNADTIPMIQVRQKVFVQDTDTSEVIGAPQYHRYVVAPDADVAELDAQVAAMATALFTQDVKDAYAAKLAEQAESGEGV